jgi:hypothetical protein
MLLGCAGRDDPDDLFAIVVLSVNMRDQKQGLEPCFDLNFAYSVPT